jgi:TonB family protein
VLERVEPREVPLPQGVSEVKVWVRVGLGRDGSVEDTKVVKSGGAEFDTSCLEAARASRFLAPQDGGTDLTVVQYVFPRAKDPSAGGRGPTAPNTSPPGAGTGPPESSPQGFPSPGAPGEDLPRSGTPPDSLLNAVPPGTVGNPVSPPEAEQPPSLRDRPIERNP